MEKINLLSECILCCTRKGTSKQDYDDIIRPSINQVVKEMKSKVKAKSSRFIVDGNRKTLKVLGLEPKGNIEHIAATLSLKNVVAIMLQEKEFALVIKNNQMKKNNYTESLASEIDGDDGTSTLYVSLIACIDAAVVDAVQHMGVLHMRILLNHYTSPLWFVYVWNLSALKKIPLVSFK